jgi:hypothetical protein
VSGLRYETATLSGLTDAEGVFRYREGETVSFFLQDLPLGQAEAGAVLTPVELVPAAQDENHPKVTNLCILLQSLDEDGDPENGILLSAAIRQAVDGLSIDLEQPTGQFTQDPELAGLLENLNELGVFTDAGSRKLRTAEEVRLHLQATLTDLDRDGDGFSPGQGDCDDSSAEAHPGAPEICGDGLDQDCDGADLACTPGEERAWYLDADGDLYASGPPLAALDRPGADYFDASQLLATSGDCDDADAGVHPGAAELCGDGIDQDCSGADLACPGGESAFDSQLRELISAYRVQNGLGALAFDGHLHDLALEHSEYMQANGVMNHDGFTGRFNRSGFNTCVENVGWNYPTPQSMFDGWRDSPGHDTNMLNAPIGWAGVSRVGAYITFFACGY